MDKFEELKILILQLQQDMKELKVNSAPSKYTFYEWIDIWLDTYKRPKLTPGALLNLERNIRLYIKPVISDKNLSEITAIEIQDCINKVPSSYIRKYTFNNFNNMFRFAKKNKLIKENVMDYVDPAKHIHKIGSALSIAQQKIFLNKIKNTKYNKLFRFYLLTGVRRSEALAIKWSDIDYSNKTIFVRGTKTYCSERKVPLFKQIKELLEQIPKVSEYIFPFTLNSIICSFKRIQATLDFDMKLHSLRHTFATRCLESGISIKVVQHWLGHASMSTTANIYSHVQTSFELEEAKKYDPKF